MARSRSGSAPIESFPNDGSQHADAVTNRVELALACSPLPLEARDLNHHQTSLRGPNVEQSFDLEPIAIRVKDTQRTLPECVEAVTEVAVASAEEPVDDRRGSDSRCAGPT
jgi:hypothetical protein